MPKEAVSGQRSARAKSCLSASPLRWLALRQDLRKLRCILNVGAIRESPLPDIGAQS
ncbi:MAG: hypothetical protein F6J93_39360 [Oscillatoria sp. SIO1A7]|nr:hypothetical protein [Oscillatoria sp. SIO1A7]